jgi:hypothetical protein
MTRLTPWGLVHHIPVLITKRKKSLDNNVLSVSKRDSILIPWKERTSSDIFLRGTKKTDGPSEITTYDDLGSLYQLLRVEKEKSEELAIRVQELEIILTEYFIDTAYLDNIRYKQSIFANTDDESMKINNDSH